ncbi:unnamed protein product [Ixodes hexagonus]
MSAFSLNVVAQSLNDCLETPQEMKIDPYLVAFKELRKFFNDLGTVFSFINSDLDSKIAIMEEYRANPRVALHYEGLCSMIAFEKGSGAIENQNKPSGARTLLRLHRALEFVAQLFQRLSTANEDAAMGSIAQQSYEETLARHHPWLIRKAAMWALLALPTCKQAFVKARPDERDHLQTLAQAISNNAYRVFNFTEAVYQKHGFLDLP